MPDDGSESPPNSTTELPPRRARRVTPDATIDVASVADPLLAADAAAANGSHDGGEATVPVAAATDVVDRPATAKTPRVSKPKRARPAAKSAAAKTAASTAAVEDGVKGNDTATKPVDKVGAERGVNGDDTATKPVDKVGTEPGVNGDDTATKPVDKVGAEPGVNGDDTATKPVDKVGAEPAPAVDTKGEKDEKSASETPSSGVPMVALGPPVASPSRADSTVETAAAIAGATTLATAVVTAPTATEAVVETLPAAPTAPVKAPKQVKPLKEKPAPAVVKARRKVRSRRVQRVVRRVDAWSVLKISFVFFIVLYLVLLVAGVLLWAFAVGTGTIDNVENFIEQLFALDSFSFVGAQILRASALGGALLVIAGTFATTVLAVLFNLISDLVGGLRFTVIEEQILRPVSPVAAPATKPTTTPSTVDGSPPAPGTV